MRTALFALALCFASAGLASAQDAPVDSLALARLYTMWLHAGSADSLAAHSTEDTRQEMEVRYGELSRMIHERAGLELEVLEETWKTRNGRCQYWRVARFSGIDEPIVVRWVLDAHGLIEGLGVGPQSQTPPVEKETCG